MTLIKFLLTILIILIIISIFNFTTNIPSEIIKEDKLSNWKKPEKSNKNRDRNIFFIVILVLFILLFIYLVYYNYHCYYYLFHAHKNLHKVLIFEPRYINFYFPYQYKIPRSLVFKRYCSTENICYNYLHSCVWTRALFSTLKRKKRKAYWIYRGQIPKWNYSVNDYNFSWQRLDNAFKIFIVIRSLLMAFFIFFVASSVFKVFKYLIKKLNK